MDGNYTLNFNINARPSLLWLSMIEILHIFLDGYDRPKMTNVSVGKEKREIEVRRS